MPDKRILLIGYGNPGRLDDGLGPAFAEAIEKMKLPGVTTDADYQLNVEDASVIAEHAAVIFADAALKGREPFFFRRLEPTEATIGFSSHSVEPDAVLAMAHQMFGAKTIGYALGIRGYEFNEFGEAISGAALKNLAEALAHMRPALESGSLEDYLTGQ